MSTAALTMDQEVWRPKFNPWLIAVVVALAAFMETLDTSIANVALPYIAGNLGASNDQSTWVLTSYLVSNAIILPISGWLAGALGRKRFFMACLGVFTVSSLLCGIAPSLGMLLFFRVLQGAGGGGLQPMAQAILADTFPPQQRGLAFALYGITAIMAPTIGPTLGGWITFNYSWRWIFFINIPVGIATWFLVRFVVEDPPYVAKLKTAGVKLDYIGIAFLTFGIGALQIVLDKGQEDDWFGSRFITTLVVVATVSLISLVIWEWFQKTPIIDVRMFKSFNFASANLMMFTLGILLFSSLVLMPQFLQTLLGYTSQLAGLALSAGGLVLLFEMPIMGALTTKIQARYLIAYGLAGVIHRHVLFHPAYRLVDQLQGRHFVAHRSSDRFGVSVRAHHHGRLRWNCAGEKQRGRRNRQFHAQHRKQRGHLPGHHVDCAAFAASPGPVGRVRPGRQSQFPEFREWPSPELGACWNERARRPHARLRHDLPNRPKPGRDSGLYRYLHGSLRVFGDHVLPGFCLTQKRSG